MISPGPLSPNSESVTLQRRLDQAAIDAEGLEYAIAHDLRTPLRAVASCAGVLLEELGGSLSEDHRHLLQRQAHNAVRFGRLIDGLLELSRLSRAEPLLREVDLSDLVSRIDPRVAVPPRMTIQADPALVERALRRLIDNALKFAPGAPVYVRKEGRGIVVVDEGAGFDPAHAARIFRPFERLVGDDVPGTGIGLALVERIARIHGGRAYAVASPRMGAAFFVEFGD